jgi:hypothetical protein
MFPINPGSPVSKTIVIFYGVHLVANVMGNHGLQFADKTAEDVHFLGWQEPCLLQSVNMARDRGKVVVNTGQAVIRPEFSSKMVSSQFAPPCASWLGLHPW